MKSSPESILREVWHELYAEQGTEKLDQLFVELNEFKEKYPRTIANQLWYKDVVVYSLYIDLFNGSFLGLTEKLDYLQKLGVNCLWLLPILDSPMKDGGFDIRRYDRIRKELLGLPDTATDEEQQAVFETFLNEAHKRDLRVIFDIAMNHISDEHEWFVSAKESKDSPYRDYFIWNPGTKKYEDTRIMFKGMLDSNWEKCGDEYFFHRFYGFQPDLNYRNPNIIIEMSRYLMFWLSKGVDGFRADAIPFIWKDEGTNCENLPKTHSVIRFYRAVLDYVRPGTLLLAEACQPPFDVVEYFGKDDECHAAYHFPLMPQIFKGLATANKNCIIDILDTKNTPAISANSQWFTFLRNHDELTLEMVTPEDRKLIHDFYCTDPRWSFRLGEGVAGRMATLLKENAERIGLAYSVMFSLPGTPIIYYGDEFGTKNDEAFYDMFRKMTGYNDARFFNRGYINWQQVENELNTPNSFPAKVYSLLNNLLVTRNKFKAFGRGSLEWVSLQGTDNQEVNQVLAFYRRYEKENILVINNLSDTEISVKLPISLKSKTDLLGNKLEIEGNLLKLKPLQYLWIEV